MYRFIFILMLLVSSNLSAQNNSPAIFENPIKDLPSENQLLNAVRSGAQNLSAQIDLNDFEKLAQRGLDFMVPGSSIRNLKCERVTGWSLSVSNELIFYLREMHKNELDKMTPGSIEDAVNQFRNENCNFGIMSWEIIINSSVKKVNSFVVFDNNGKVLYDTELAKFVTGTSENESSETIFEEDTNSPNSSASITNQRSGSMTYSYTVEGTFSTVRHYNKVSATAIVPPYITAATNDAFFNSQTTEIISERRDIEPFAPPTEPCLYFGTDGTIANSYSSAVPFQSRVYLSNSNDHFNDGEYRVSGSNGHSWSFTFDFSVSAGPVGLGITPQQSSPEFTLSATSFSEVRVKNYVYYYLLGNTYRALFYDGGALRLNDFNILTGNATGERGAVNVKYPMQVAYWSYLVLHPYSFTGVTLSLLNVQYLRGDHVNQPDYRLTSSNYNIPIGQTDTLRAKVSNTSLQVKLSGGNISLNVSSLGDKLTLLSPATLPIGEINTNSSKTYNFIVRGNANGTATPQVNISSAGWTWPVPPDVVINNIFSIDSNISVGSVGINQTSTEVPAEYSISQNYPNPFNPVTNINFSIPKEGFVKVIIYDVLGKEIQTIVNENLRAGYYKTDFDGSKLSSGVYFYRIVSKDFSSIKKMTLLK